MATHSNILAWRIPWTEELGELYKSMGSQRVLHNSPNQMYYLLLLSHSPMSDSLQSHGLQHASSVFLVLHCLPEFAQTYVYWLGDAIQPSHPLLLPLIFPSIRVFPSESALCIRWPKDWSFSLNTSSSNEYSGLISFRIDWFDVLAV